MNGLAGGPLLVGGSVPARPAPLKSGTDMKRL